ncbi:MAG: GNAT family N-acetyltransferase [Bacteroidota bacterium]
MTAVRIVERSESDDAAAFVAQFAAAPALLRHPPHAGALAPAQSWRSLIDLPTGAARAFWLAQREGTVLGRVGACLSPHYPGAGYVGFFEVDTGDAEAEITAARLLDQACRWLRAQGARLAYGPLDLATWFNYRFRVPAVGADANENDEPPFWWEPENPPEYTRWFTSQGFSEAQRFHSHGFSGDPPGVAEMIVAFTGMARDGLREKGFSFRPIDPARLGDELPILHRISMESFSDNLLFEPISLAVFEGLYRATADRVDYGLSQFVVDPQGHEAGFVFGFVDRGYAVVKSIAVLPAFRGLHLSTALLHLVLAGALARGVRRGISALVRAGSRSQFLEGKHQMVRGWRHEYALFQKTLV